MAEKRPYAFASSELQWLNNALVSSHSLRRTTFMQHLSQDKGNPALVTRENSSKSSSHLAKSNGGLSKGKGTLKGKKLLIDILTATALAPIERVSILMQCQNEMIKAGRLSTHYKGMTDCLLRTIKHEGVISLWRGNSVNVIRLCLFQAMPFVLVHLPYKNYMHKKMEESPLLMTPLSLMPLMLLRYSLDYAQVRLASDVKAPERLNFSLDSSCQTLRNNIEKRQFCGVFDVYKKTLKLDGIHGPFRGFSVYGIGVVAHSYMSVELDELTSKERLNQKKKTKLALVIMLVMLCSLPVVEYPFRTVSRRMMMTSASREASKYNGAVDAFYQIVKNEGVSALFKGVTPYIIHDNAKVWGVSGLFYLTYLVVQKITK